MLLGGGAAASAAAPAATQAATARQRPCPPPTHRPCRWDSATSSYLPTSLGKATLSSNLPPEDCLLVRQDLLRARQGFVMASDLHLTFLVTPIRSDLELDWQRFYDLHRQLNTTEQRVGELVGLNQSYLQVGGLGGWAWNRCLPACLPACPP